MQQLVESQRAATRSGDPSRIISRSRALVAAVLSELAAMRAEAKDHADAVSLYKSALATEPSTTRELDLAGELLVDGDAADAKALADAVLLTEPKNRIALAISSGTSSPAPSRPSLGPSQTLAGEGYLRRVLSRAYDDWGVAIIRQQSDYHGASLLFEAATHWDLTTPGAMRDLGLATFRLGHFQASADAFSAVLEATPQDEQAHLLLGLSLFSLKQFAQASSSFAPVPQAVMSNNDAAYAWAFSLAHTGQPLQANHILDAIASRPMSAENRLLICQVYDQTEDYQQAIPCLQKVAAEDPSLPRVHYEIGVSLIHLSRPADAIPQLRKEVELHPDDLDAQTYLAYALTESDQKPEAEKLLESVVQQQPENGDAQYQLGKLLAEQQQWPEAIIHLQAAVAVKPRDAEIHYQLQNAYRRNDQPQKAAYQLAIYRSLKDEARSGESTHEGSPK